MSLFRRRSETGSSTDRRCAVSDAAKWKEGQRASHFGRTKSIHQTDLPLRGCFCSIRLFVCFVLICQVCVSGTTNEPLNIQSLLFIPDTVIKDATQLTRPCANSGNPSRKGFSTNCSCCFESTISTMKWKFYYSTNCEQRLIVLKQLPEPVVSSEGTSETQPPEKDQKSAVWSALLYIKPFNLI